MSSNLINKMIHRMADKAAGGLDKEFNLQYKHKPYAAIMHPDAIEDLRGRGDKARERMIRNGTLPTTTKVRAGVKYPEYYRTQVDPGMDPKFIKIALDNMLAETNTKEETCPWTVPSFKMP